MMWRMWNEFDWREVDYWFRDHPFVVLLLTLVLMFAVLFGPALLGQWFR